MTRQCACGAPLPGARLLTCLACRADQVKVNRDQPVLDARTKHRQRYHALKAAGLCPKCGKVAPVPGAARCLRCQAPRSAVRAHGAEQDQGLFCPLPARPAARPVYLIDGRVCEVVWP